MGFSNFLTLFKKYIDSRKYIEQNNYTSDVCYIDFTNKIISVCYTINKHGKYNMRDSFDFEVTPYQTENEVIKKIDYICQICAKILYSQIISSSIYKKFIIISDYKFRDSVSRYIDFGLNRFSNIKDCYANSPYDDVLIEEHKFTPVVPSNAPLNETLKDVVRNLYEVTTSFWNPIKTTEYITLDSLLKDPSMSEEQLKYVNEAYRVAINRFIMFRFMKHSEIVKRRKNNNRFDIPEQLMESKTFNEDFKDSLMNIPYTIIISMLPVIKKYCEDNLCKHSEYHVEFYGCECESDYVLYKHVITYNRNNHPTIYTRDSDIIQLLWNIDCNIRFNIEKQNININPIYFWRWLFNAENVNYNDIIMFCILSGTDYNGNKSKSYKPFVGLYDRYKSKLTFKEQLIYKMYSQKKYIENHLHQIESSPLIELNIESRYFNPIYDIILSNDSYPVITQEEKAIENEKRKKNSDNNINNSLNSDSDNYYSENIFIPSCLRCQKY